MPRLMTCHGNESPAALGLAHLAQAERELPRAHKAARVPVGRVVRGELWQVPVLAVLDLLQVLQTPRSAAPRQAGA